MPAKVFVTGFPGFLGSELVRRILARPGRPDVGVQVDPPPVGLDDRRDDAQPQTGRSTRAVA